MVLFGPAVEQVNGNLHSACRGDEAELSPQL